MEDIDIALTLFSIKVPLVGVNIVVKGRDLEKPPTYNIFDDFFL